MKYSYLDIIQWFNIFALFLGIFINFKMARNYNLLSRVLHEKIIKYNGIINQYEKMMADLDKVSPLRKESEKDA